MTHEFAFLKPRAMSVNLRDHGLFDLRDGQARGVDPTHQGRDTVFVVRRCGRYYAYEDRCPHYGDTPMAWRKDAYLNRDGTRIVCSAHGAEFDIETGECLIGPCIGQPLKRVAIETDQDDGGLLTLAAALQICIPT